MSYPYSIPNAINLTGNNFGGQYYYYFILRTSVSRVGLTCTSNKVQVTVDMALQVCRVLMPQAFNSSRILRTKSSTSISSSRERLPSTSMMQQEEGYPTIRSTIYKTHIAIRITTGSISVELMKSGNRYQQKLIKY